jgi:LysM repeat protein
VSSLRPLATIALLAAVGVFLYMKINETETKLPPELEDWATSSLEVGDPNMGMVDVGPPQGGATAPPPIAGDEAPPFSSAQLSPAPPAQSLPPGDAAPWTPPAVDAGDAAADAESSPVARTAETPALPAMPPASAGASTTPTDAAALLAGAPAITDATTESSANAAATTPPEPAPSMFEAARVQAHSALDRGELAKALEILSEWYGDPSLTATEKREVEELLSQLAGSVIYEGPPAHRVAPPYFVKDGESLESIAQKYSVPWQLLAKINGIGSAGPLPTGQELKVMQGPFSAQIDLSERNLTLMLGRRYAGKFALDIDPAMDLPESEWKVDQKLLTPANPGIYSAAGAPSEDRSLLLANADDPTSQAVLLRGPGSADPVSPDPKGLVIRLKAGQVEEVYDILSVGSRVTIRR